MDDSDQFICSSEAKGIMLLQQLRVNNIMISWVLPARLGNRRGVQLNARKVVLCVVTLGINSLADERQHVPTPLFLLCLRGSVRPGNDVLSKQNSTVASVLVMRPAGTSLLSFLLSPHSTSHYLASVHIFGMSVNVACKETLLFFFFSRALWESYSTSEPQQHF